MRKLLIRFHNWLGRKLYPLHGVPMQIQVFCIGAGGGGGGVGKSHGDKRTSGEIVLFHDDTNGT